MKTLYMMLTLILMTVTPTLAMDATLKWDTVAGATGYKLYQSNDKGATWDTGTDVGNVTEYLAIGLPDVGIIMFRVSAYNANGEAIRYDAGVWACGDCLPPFKPSGIGVQ